MLKSVIIILHIIIIIIGIGEKIVFNGKDISGGHIELGQEYVLGLPNHKGLITVEAKVFS
jgi:hypothetical protein